MMISDKEKYYSAERNELTDFLEDTGSFKFALDIGCAAGILGETIVKKGLVSLCDGIEPYAPAACMAEAKLRKVWKGSFEDAAKEIDFHCYDLIIMADVLEHLVDPWSVLKLLHKKTNPGCKILLSVPNIRHYKITFPLLFRGEFRYQDDGIMDKTHLHFFTKKSLIETLNTCGWKLLKIGNHMKSRYRKSFVPTKLIEPFVAVQYITLVEKHGK